MLRVLLLIIPFCISGIPVHAQEEISFSSTFYKARVTEVVEEGTHADRGTPWQDVLVKILDGDKNGDTIYIEQGKQYDISDDKKVSVGDVVVINQVLDFTGESWFISDNYRLTPIMIILGLFFLLTVVFGGKKGLMSIVGLSISISIIMLYILPSIVAGKSPLTVSFIGGFFIMLITLFLAHGFNRRTTVAFAGTSITLLITIWLSNLFVHSTHLFGAGSEDVFLLQGQLEHIDTRGLLLGAIIIGVLGVLDDITTAQSAVVYELKHANPALSPSELYKRGLRVGKEHIASLVNTLAMAYVGASLPLLLLITLNAQNNLWVVINSELIAEEIIRTLVGSTALVLAVPITTLIAAHYFGKMQKFPDAQPGHSHIHG